MNLKGVSLVLVALSALIIVSGCIGSDTGPGQYDSFANCLTETGVTMYGTEWCSHCKNQKALFGSSFKNINYVDCDLSSDKCQLAGVRGYPTWVIDGELYPGERSLSELASLSGCELTQDVLQ